MRFPLGVIVGFLIAAVPAWAGWYTSGSDLYRERGANLQYFYGYVAGAHDVLAGYYPNHGHRLGVITDKVAEHALKTADKDLAAVAGMVVVAAVLLDMKIITGDDAERILPKSVLERIRREGRL